MDDRHTVVTTPASSLVVRGSSCRVPRALLSLALGSDSSDRTNSGSSVARDSYARLSRLTGNAGLIIVVPSVIVVVGVADLRLLCTKKNSVQMQRKKSFIGMKLTMGGYPAAGAPPSIDPLSLPQEHLMGLPCTNWFCK